MFSRNRGVTEKLFYCFLLLMISLSLCAWNPFAKTEEPQKEEISPKEEPTVPSEIDLEQKKIQEKREELNNTEWDIAVLPSAETGSSLWDNDILRFTGGEIISQGFKTTGYPASRYTIRIKNGKGCWETMQRAEDGKTTIFWKGDWENDKMTGMFSIQKEAGNIESYSFHSISKKNIEENVK